MYKALHKLNQRLLDMQYKTEIESDWINDSSYLYFDKIQFAEYNGLFDITWNGATWDYNYFNPDNEIPDDEYDDQGFGWFLELLLKHSAHIRSLYFTSPDKGANGLLEWELDRLIDSNVIFNNLVDFRVKLCEQGDHNMSTIASIDDEARSNQKKVSQLLLKMPNIVSIMLPCVPDESFFSYKFPKLKMVKFQCDTDHGNFIRNLSESKLLSQISLDFADVISSDFGNVTPYMDYLKLFSSEFITKGFHFKLREYQLTDSQLFELQRLNKEIQFLHIPLKEERYI